MAIGRREGKGPQKKNKGAEEFDWALERRSMKG